MSGDRLPLTSAAKNYAQAALAARDDAAVTWIEHDGRRVAAVVPCDVAMRGDWRSIAPPRDGDGQDAATTMTGPAVRPRGPGRLNPEQYQAEVRGEWSSEPGWRCGPGCRYDQGGCHGPECRLDGDMAGSLALTGLLYGEHVWDTLLRYYQENPPADHEHREGGPAGCRWCALFTPSPGSGVVTWEAVVERESTWNPIATRCPAGLMLHHVEQRLSGELTRFHDDGSPCDHPEGWRDGLLAAIAHGGSDDCQRCGSPDLRYGLELTWPGDGHLRWCQRPDCQRDGNAAIRMLGDVVRHG